MNSKLPSGTVTFLFTDIEGSTHLWQEMPEAMSLSHARHDIILRDAIESNNGFVINIAGDSFNAAFHNALDGLRAALAAQRALQAEPWGETGAVRVRMGLHTGAAKKSTDKGDVYHEGYATIASAQRVMSVANGGQVLLSDTTRDLLRNALPDDVTLRDMGEHRLKDLHSPLHLYQLIAPELTQDFPPIKSLDLHPNNLPVELTRFIGRDTELAEVKRLLAGTRLLTLTGTGGTGKTRLSLQAAASVLEEFPQGAWLVELAPVMDPQIVVPVVANILAVRETSGRTLQDALVDYLRYKTLLLVLDNCEHLIEACARLANGLLHACPNIKILASSREALGITGETSFRVPSLSLAPISYKPGGMQLAEIEQSEAVRLFVERAQAVSPAFILNGDNALAVAQICRRLDGIPLAIELAAARVKVLTPAQIASRLDDRFRLLTGGSRTALPRQQTLKAMIDWSWTLLSDNEKILLRRLAVFAGGFTLEAVESICVDPVPATQGTASVSQYDILDLLEDLVNKSLILAGEDSGAARYRLLETIRQFALDQLLLSTEASNMRDRHLEYFSRLAGETEPHLLGAEMIEWIDRLERDADNLRAAMEWGLKSCNPSAIYLTKYLFQYWWVCGLDSEGLRWLDPALACLPSAIPQESDVNTGQAGLRRQAIQAYLLGGTSILTANLGKIIPAIQYAEEAVRSARGSDDQNALGYALAMEALAKSFLEVSIPQAKTAAEESLALAQQLGDVWLQSFSLSIFTNITKGDQIASQHYQQEHARLARQIGNPWAIGMSIFGLLITSREQVNLLEIRQEMEEGIRLFTRMRNYPFIAALRSELAHILRHQGELDEAEAIYSETIHEWLELGNQAAVAHQLECLAALAVARRHPERAARLLGAAHNLRARLCADMAPNERIDYDATLANMRLSLDRATLQSVWRSGEEMSLEQAVAFALVS